MNDPADWSLGQSEARVVVGCATQVPLMQRHAPSSQSGSREQSLSQLPQWSSLVSTSTLHAGGQPKP